MASIRGSAALEVLMRDMSFVASPAWRKGLVKALALEAQEQTAKGFALERDPYGRPWKRSARAAAQGGQTLSDTARLRRSFTTRSVTERGFILGTNVRYAKIHQTGGVIRPKGKKALRFKIGSRYVMAKKVVIPKRMMLPEGTLGGIWDQAFQNAAIGYMWANRP